MREASPPGDITRTKDLHCSFQNTWVWIIFVPAIVQCLIDSFMIYENKAQLKESWDAISYFVGLIENAFEVQYFSSDAGRAIDDG